MVTLIDTVVEVSEPKDVVKLVQEVHLADRLARMGGSIYVKTSHDLFVVLLTGMEASHAGGKVAVDEGKGGGLVDYKPCCDASFVPENVSDSRGLGRGGELRDPLLEIGPNDNDEVNSP